jgi:hypothetical protein
MSFAASVAANPEHAKKMRSVCNTDFVEGYDTGDPVRDDDRNHD